MAARHEDVGDLALIDEQRRLPRTHDELRAVLDLLLRPRETLHHRVARLVEPLDDVDQLAGNEFTNRHGILRSQ